MASPGEGKRTSWRGLRIAWLGRCPSVRRRRDSAPRAATWLFGACRRRGAGRPAPSPFGSRGAGLGATTASAAEARRARTFETGPRAEGTVFSDAQPRERSVGARDAVVEDPSRPRWRRDLAEHGGLGGEAREPRRRDDGFRPGPRIPGTQGAEAPGGRARPARSKGRAGGRKTAKRTAIYIEIRRAVRYRDEARVGSVTSSEGVGRFSSGKHLRGPNHHVTRRPYSLADA